jgi:hypothetical protein
VIAEPPARSASVRRVVDILHAMHPRFRLRTSEEVCFSQVRALRQSDVVALCLPRPEGVVTI